MDLINEERFCQLAGEIYCGTADERGGLRIRTNKWGNKLTLLISGEMEDAAWKFLDCRSGNLCSVRQRFDIKEGRESIDV